MEELRKNHSEDLCSVQLDALQVLLNQYRDAQKNPKEPSGGSDELAGCFSLSRSLEGLIEVKGTRMKYSASLSIAAE